jgi:hypothetical protein
MASSVSAPYPGFSFTVPQLNKFAIRSRWRKAAFRSRCARSVGARCVWPGAGHFAESAPASATIGGHINVCSACGSPLPYSGRTKCPQSQNVRAMHADGRGLYAFKRFDELDEPYVPGPTCDMVLQGLRPARRCCRMIPLFSPHGDARKQRKQPGQTQVCP